MGVLNVVLLASSIILIVASLVWILFNRVYRSLILVGEESGAREALKQALQGKDELEMSRRRMQLTDAQTDLTKNQSGLRRTMLVLGVGAVLLIIFGVRMWLF